MTPDCEIKHLLKKLLENPKAPNLLSSQESCKSLSITWQHKSCFRVSQTCQDFGYHFHLSGNVMVHKMFHKKQYIYGLLHIITIYHTCKYHIPMSNTHCKCTLVHMKYTIYNIQHLCYLDADENGTLNLFSLFSFSFILSLV